MLSLNVLLLSLDTPEVREVMAKPNLVPENAWGAQAVAGGR